MKTREQRREEFSTAIDSLMTSLEEPAVHEPGKSPREIVLSLFGAEFDAAVDNLADERVKYEEHQTAVCRAIDVLETKPGTGRLYDAAEAVVVSYLEGVSGDAKVDVKPEATSKSPGNQPAEPTQRRKR